MFELRQTPWPANAIHVVLDWETMSTAHNAAPVQLGARVIGDSISGSPEFNEYIDPKSSEAAGLHVSVETMQWWDKQDPTVRRVVFGGTKSIETVMYEFMNWLEATCFDYAKDAPDWSRIYLWGNGVEFDVSLLRNVHEEVIPHIKFPVSFRNFDHVRTLYRCVPQSVLTDATDEFNRKFPLAEVHNASGDAMYHSHLVRVCLKWLEVSQADYHQGVSSHAH